MGSTECGPVLYWPEGPAPRRPKPDEIHVWASVLRSEAEDVRRVQGWLSPGPAQVAARLRHARDRTRYILAQAFLRDVLAGYLNCLPGKVPLTAGLHGKPVLADSGESMAFNLSHSESVALLAVTSGCEVGVDTELIREDPNWLRVAEQLFSPREKAILAALPETERLESFFACWTRKEALLKLTGVGLGTALDGFSVEVSLEAAEPRLVGQKLEVGALPADDKQEHYSLHSLYPAPGYIAAVAVNGLARHLRLWSYRP
ncbi:MAG: 4'-phosphopantetheinyl transferase superfamily protein [Armatimonadia bacterium]